MLCCVAIYVMGLGCTPRPLHLLHHTPWHTLPHLPLCIAAAPSPSCSLLRISTSAPTPSCPSLCIKHTLLRPPLAPVPAAAGPRSAGACRAAAAHVTAQVGRTLLPVYGFKSCQLNPLQHGPRWWQSPWCAAYCDSLHLELCVRVRLCQLPFNMDKMKQYGTVVLQMGLFPTETKFSLFSGCPA
jgi:hypothetical protein